MLDAMALAYVTVLGLSTKPRDRPHWHYCRWIGLPAGRLQVGPRDRGWLEGENIGFELRAAVGELRRLPKFANQIASAGVDAIAVTHVPREDIATKSTSIGQIMAAAAFSRISASSLGY